MKAKNYMDLESYRFGKKVKKEDCKNMEFFVERNTRNYKNMMEMTKLINSHSKQQ